MWRRESIGGISTAVGDSVGVTASALRPADSNAQWNRHHHHHHPLPRRFDSTELADSPVRNEALKLLRELNRAVAGHVALATMLGGSGDGPNLRDELRRARRTAQETAAAAKSTLLPSLMDPQKSSNELERLWYLLLCCLDALELSMHRCLTLLREFSVADGNNVVMVIRTGIDGPMNNIVVTRPLPVNATTATAQDKEKERELELQYRDRVSLEGVEASQLCKELFELRTQLEELKSSVELPSLAEERFEDRDPSLNKGPRRTDTLISINGADMLPGSAALGSPSCSIPSDDKESLESEASQSSGITNAQRKCICWVLGSMVALFFLAMILGVFIALFS